MAKTKTCYIIIAKDSSDPRTSVFAGLNGTNLNIPVGVKTRIPADLYEKVLTKGNLKDRVTYLGDA